MWCVIKSCVLVCSIFGYCFLGGLWVMYSTRSYCTQIFIMQGTMQQIRLSIQSTSLWQFMHTVDGKSNYLHIHDCLGCVYCRYCKLLLLFFLSVSCFIIYSEEDRYCQVTSIRFNLLYLLQVLCSLYTQLLYAITHFLTQSKHYSTDVFRSTTHAGHLKY